MGLLVTVRDWPVARPARRSLASAAALPLRPAALALQSGSISSPSSVHAPTDLVLGHIDGEAPEGTIPSGVLERVLAAAPDVLVVLGARVRHGEPGRHLTQRLRVALALYRALERRPAILLTGGRGEALAMREWMLAHGVPSSQLVLETRSRNTFQNARYSMAILERQAGRFRSALLVTTAVRHRGRRFDNHARRALDDFLRFASRVRLSAVSVNADPTIQPRVYISVRRARGGRGS